MFGRSTFVTVATLTLGAVGVAAQTTPQIEKYNNCAGSIVIRDFEPRVNWGYDDTAFYNASFSYNPEYCDSTIPVNYIRLEDYIGGGIYGCTRQQFDPSRNTVYSQCSLRQ